MRVMLDTNIIISAAFFPNGAAAKFCRLVLSRHRVFVSSYSLGEAGDVVRRKFRGNERVLDAFMENTGILMVKTPEKFDGMLMPHIRDMDDWPVLASAMKTNMDVLVTGDKDFDSIEITRPKIMTIAAFTEHFLR